MDRRNLLSVAGKGFLAFVGGAAVSGAVQRASAATSPTLILPPGLVTASAAWPDLMAGGHPPVHLRKFNSEMDVILHVKSGLDRAAYCLWLDVGLLMVHGGRRARLMARSPAERTADAVAYALVDLHVIAEILEGLACAADTERVDIPGSWMRWFGRQISDVANAIDVASLGDDSTAEPGA